jgi:4-hydroxybenzoate polyprenyltransferase
MVYLKEGENMPAAAAGGGWPITVALLAGMLALVWFVGRAVIRRFLDAIGRAKARVERAKRDKLRSMGEEP